MIVIGLTGWLGRNIRLLSFDLGRSAHICFLLLLLRINPNFDPAVLVLQKVVL